MLDNRTFHGIIKELCKELNIKMEIKSYGWILKLTKNNITKYIVGNNFPLNSESSSIIVSDKYATYEMLESFGIPAVKHTILFNPSERGDYIPKEGNYSTVFSEFAKYGALVVKPNVGFEGNGVTLCKTIKEVEIAIQNLFKTNSAICICPYYKIEKEYRVFYLNGKAKLIYGKEKPVVIGDGISTLGQLITKNHLPEKPVVTENLASLDLSMIPKDNQIVELSWKHNLSGGATATVLEKASLEQEKLYKNIEELALKAGEATDVNFATIDIIRTVDNRLYVMEINSGISTTIFSNTVQNGRELVKNVFRDALNEMFK